jgi:hypothetical protein
MKNFIKNNWFKIVIIILIAWFLLILSRISFSDHFSIDVCLKEASGLPSFSTKRCW